VLSWRLSSVGDSRLLEVAFALVACLLGRSASVRAGGARLSVAEVEGVGDLGFAARTVDLAPPDAAAAPATGGPAVAYGAEPFIAGTSNPNSRWIAQQARNLLMQLADRGQSFRFLLHDRDSKFSGAFKEIFRSEGITIVRTPIRAPNANAYAERWVGTLRRECLDRILIVNRRQLERVLRVYTAHYNGHRPHRSLSLPPPDEPTSAPGGAPIRHIERHKLLGGLINEYKAAA
jgi:putative transposase